MDDRYRIRPVERRDLEAVAAIECESFSDPWPAAAFAEHIGPASLGAFGGGALVGYVFVRLGRADAEILNVAVQPSHRRQGIGKRLVMASIERCAEQGARVVYLEVRQSNEAARQLYRDLGFEGLYRRRGYYRHPTEDALVLRLDLTCKKPLAKNGYRARMFG